MSVWHGITLSLLLALATAHDLAQRRIPNRVLWPAALVAMVMAAAWGGIGGLASALGAGVVGAAVFAPLYLLGQMGGGDLKLLATVGLLVGLPRITAVCLAVAMAGGLLALCWLWRARTRPAGDALPRMPYALAVALGSATHGWLPSAVMPLS
jgi:prepilin peptidase CpaA